MVESEVMMNEIEIVSSILSKPLKEKGYSLYDVKFKRAKESILEVIVDRPEPIGLDDIVELSGFVSALLDEADPIEGAYTLDLSSAGAEKRIALDDLPSYVGRYVHLHLTHPVKGENILEGTLSSVEENVTLICKVKTRKVELSFPRATIDEARLAIEF